MKEDNSQTTPITAQIKRLLLYLEAKGRYPSNNKRLPRVFHRSTNVAISVEGYTAQVQNTSSTARYI